MTRAELTTVFEREETPMNLYLIKRAEEEFGPDENIAHVVASDSEEGARAIAAYAAVDEDPGLWFEPERSTVALIGTALAGMEPGIVLTEDLNGG